MKIINGVAIYKYSVSLNPTGSQEVTVEAAHEEDAAEKALDFWNHRYGLKVGNYSRWDIYDIVKIHDE